jgi:hypothetical protein
MSTLLRRPLPVSLLIALVLAIAVTPAHADPVVTAFNAPAGVYGRSAPNWDSAVQDPGFGLYDGTLVAAHCWSYGSTVPGSSDDVWEEVTDVGGPGYGSFWADEHFLDDSSTIDTPTPGVPECAPGESPTQSTGIPQPATGATWTAIAQGDGSVRAMPDVDSEFYGETTSGSTLTVYCWVDGGWGDGNYWTDRWFDTQVPGDTTGLTGFINASLVAQPQPDVPECA